MWLGSHSTVFVYYRPSLAPEFFSLLGLLPLATLLICALSVLDLFTQEGYSRWLRLWGYSILLLLMGVFLFPAIVVYRSPQLIQIGLALCLSGWLLVFLSVFLCFSMAERRSTASQATLSPQQRTRRNVLRGLVGFTGLATLSTAGFLVWRTWRTHTAITTYRYSDPGVELMSRGDNTILSVNWSRDGKRILVGQLHAPPQSWDALTGENRYTYQPTRAHAGAWSPDGQHIALADLISVDDPTLIIVNATHGAKEAEAPFSTRSGNAVQVMAWCSDSQSLAWGGLFSSGSQSLGASIQIWHAFTGKIGKSYLLPYHDSFGRFISLACSPDDKYLAAMYFRSPPNITNADVFIWHKQNGSLLMRYRTTQLLGLYSGKLLDWSPDSQYLTLANGSRVQILDVASQRVLLTYTSHANQIAVVAYSPDGKHLASGSFDAVVQVWKSSTGELGFLYLRHTSTISDIAWSPNGKYLATGSSDGSVQVWQPEI